jgi:glycerate 2-kinase
MKPRVVARRLEGEAREAGRRFGRAARQLAPGAVLLAGGETTVTLSRRPGKGGRNLELALAAALELDGYPEIALLAAGSDGVDGSSRAAGAFADGTTLDRARERGLDLDEALRRHDTERFFAELKDLFVTGPTGTNVCDWSFAIRASRA